MKYNRSFNGAPQSRRPLTKCQIAEVLQVTPRTINHWMQRKLIPDYRLGHSVYFNQEEVAAAISKGRFDCRSNVAPIPFDLTIGKN